MRSLAFKRFKSRHAETHCVACEVLQLKFALSSYMPKGTRLKALCMIHEAREDGTYEEDPFASSKASVVEG